MFCTIYVAVVITLYLPLAACIEASPEDQIDEPELTDNAAELATAAELVTAADPDFHCTNDNTADSNATPWFDNHYDVKWALSRSLLDQHIPQGLATWENY